MGRIQAFLDLLGTVKGLGVYVLKKNRLWLLPIFLLIILLFLLMGSVQTAPPAVFFYPLI